MGLTQAMSYWTFSNVFEEGGVPSGIFNQTFGLMDQWGIARPSLHAFVFLHKLGDTQLQSGEGPVLATRRADGSSAVLVWNLIPARGSNSVANGNPLAAGGGSSHSQGADLTLTLRLAGLAGRTQAQVSRIGGSMGSAIPAWKAMGSPQYPTQDQLKSLRDSAELPQPETVALAAGEPSQFTLTLPPNGVALLEFPK